MSVSIMSRSAAIVSVAALLFAGGTAASHAAPARSTTGMGGVTFVQSCRGPEYSKPQMLMVDCTKGNTATLRKIRWSNWGKNSASAVAVYEVRTKSGVKRYPVRVQVRDLQKREATQAYGTMRITFLGKRPVGHARVTTFAVGHEV